MSDPPVTIEQNVRRRVLWPLGIAIFVSLAIFLLISDYYLDLGMHRSQEARLQALTSRYHNYMLERSGLMRSILQLVRRDSRLVDALARQDREALLAAATPLFKELLTEQQITHFYFHSADGINLLRVHKPERHGDRIERLTLKTAQRTGHISDGLELGPLGTFTLRVVAPVQAQGRLIGFLELGEDIDPVLDQLAAEIDARMAVLIDKQLLDRKAWSEGRQMLGAPAPWDLLPDYALGGVNTPQLVKKLPHLATAGAIAHRDTVEVRLHERTHRGRFLSLMDASGRTVGLLLVLEDVESALDDHYHAVLMVSGFCTLLAIILFTIASSILRRADHNLKIVGEQLAALAPAPDDNEAPKSGD